MLGALRFGPPVRGNTGQADQTNNVPNASQPGRLHRSATAPGSLSGQQHCSVKHWRRHHDCQRNERVGVEGQVDQQRSILDHNTPCEPGSRAMAVRTWPKASLQARPGRAGQDGQPAYPRRSPPRASLVAPPESRLSWTGRQRCRRRRRRRRCWRAALHKQVRRGRSATRSPKFRVCMRSRLCPQGH